MTKLQAPKGTRDFPPEEKILRQEIESRLRILFELYGFNPIETPVFELYDTLASKYAGGAEILKETYTFEDQGKRKLGLRYDFTVPFARFVALNPTLKKPFKRYQIGPVFRDGPMKLGRYRQFDQCDVDVVGASSLIADAELLALASSFFKLMRLDVTIYVNNRKLLNALLDAAGVPEKLQESAILSIDKLKKIGITGVSKELEEKGVSTTSIKKISEIFDIPQISNIALVERFAKMVKDQSGSNEMAELLQYAEALKVSNIRFDPSLARGLAYYTGTVFEVFANDSSVTSSLAAGGRYDNMIGNLVGSSEVIPAVGLSVGLDAVLETLKAARAIELKKSVVMAYVIPINTLKESLELVNTLRESGIATDMDLSGKSISKNLDFANAYAIPFVIIVGQKELAEGKVKLKSMALGEEKIATIQEIIELFTVTQRSQQ